MRPDIHIYIYIYIQAYQLFMTDHHSKRTWGLTWWVPKKSHVFTPPWKFSHNPCKNSGVFSDFVCWELFWEVDNLAHRWHFSCLFWGDHISLVRMFGQLQLEQWNKGPNGCLGYIGDNQLPSYMVIISWTVTRIPSLNNQDSMNSTVDGRNPKQPPSMYETL